MPPTESWLVRLRTVLTIAASTVAFVALIQWNSTPPDHTNAKALHRSNAVRRPRRSQSIEVRVHQSPNELQPLGVIVIARGDNIVIRHSLDQATFVSVEQLASQLDISLDQAQPLYQQAVLLAVEEILRACYDNITFSDRAHRSTSTRLSRLLGLSRDVQMHADAWIADHHADLLVSFIHAPTSMTVAIHRTMMEELSRLRGSSPSDRHTAASPVNATLGSEARESITRSRASNAQTDDLMAEELKGLLYYIAEEQAKRRANKHRGIRCDECGVIPIPDIRWHCLNCPDCDLCSNCKPRSTHQRNHVFAEIKIPIPVLSQPFGMAPLLYPGSDIAIHMSLSPSDRQRLAHDYDLEEPEVDALADQFCCLANVYSLDPSAPLRSAIDRHAFAKAVTTDRWHVQQQSNLVINRMFAFYDTDAVGQIDFCHFLSGMSYLRGKDRYEPLRRALLGFDLDNDGLVGRSHFLKLLRAKFDLHQALIVETAECEEAVFTRHNLPRRLQSSQPIGAMFLGDIPHGSRRDPTRNKIRDANGDLVPPHGINLIQQLDQVPMLEGGVVEQLSPADRAVLGIGAGPAQINERPGTADSVFLWDLISRAINELLDVIFKPVESVHKKILSTKSERTTWGAQIREVARSEATQLERLQVGVGHDPVLDTAFHATTISPGDHEDIGHFMRSAMVLTDAASLDRMEADLSRQSLDTLLETSGYSLVVTDDSHDAIEEQDQAVSSASDAHLDPTMPQHRPNAIPESQAARAGEPAEVACPPYKRLQYLALIEKYEERLPVKMGEACLTLDQVEAAVKLDVGQDAQKLIKSWLSWAAF